MMADVFFTVVASKVVPQFGIAKLVYRMGYRPGAADPPFLGGGRDGSDKWSRCYIYIYVYIYISHTHIYIYSYILFYIWYI